MFGGMADATLFVNAKLLADAKLLATVQRYSNMGMNIASRDVICLVYKAEQQQHSRENYGVVVCHCCGIFPP